MAFVLPKTSDPSFPAVGGLGYVGAADDDNQITMAAGMFTKRLVAGGKWLWLPVGATNPVPTVDVSGTPELLTSTPLAASGVFTGPVIDRYAGVLVGKVSGAVYTDQAGTLYLDHSKDNVTWEQVTSLPSIVNDLAELPWTAVTRRYARLRYVNGATAQTVFRLWQSLRPKSITDVELTGSIVTSTSRYQWEDTLAYGLDKYFLCRVVTQDGTFSGVPSDYWSHNAPIAETGSFTVPGTKNIIALYSKRSHRYGVMVAQCKFVRPVVASGTLLREYLGFEGGAAGGAGSIYFRYEWNGSTAQLYVHAGSLAQGLDVDITSFLPANHDTTYHRYEIKIGRHIAYAKIDDKVVAIFVDAEKTDGSAPFLHQSLPYALCEGLHIPKSLPGLVEMRVERGSGDTNSYSWPLSPYDVRFEEDDSPRYLIVPLYETASSTTLLTKTIDTGVLYTAYLPLFAASKAVLRSNQGFAAEIQNRASYGSQFAYKVTDASGTANTPVVIDIPKVNGVGRLKITPSAYPATFDIAEASLYD